MTNGERDSAARVRRRTNEPPRLAWLPAALALAFLLLPLASLLVFVPWTSLRAELTSEAALNAAELSLVCSVVATALSVVLGLPLAWIFARSSARGLALARAAVTLPAVLPPVVGGVALLLAFGRNGILGSWLEGAFGITLPFTTAGAVLSEAFVAMPFFVFAAEAGFRSADPRLDEAAATLGAGPWRRWFFVTLPLAAPAIGAGVALCWARAIGEFGATITFAGNFPGRTQTMPLAVLNALETSPESAIALSFVMLALSAVVILAFRRRLRLG